MTLQVLTLAESSLIKLADLLRVLAFFYYFKRIKYTRALAVANQLTYYQEILLPYLLWAYYQLGMYKSVCHLNYNGKHWRGLYASAICNSACGNADLAENYLTLFKAHSKFLKHSHKLAESLAPFSPALAYSAHKFEATSRVDNVDLNNLAKDMLLEAALLQKLNHHDQATEILNAFSQTHINKTKLHHHLVAEFHLLSINASKLNPFQQLKRINDFLTCYKLKPVILKNDHLPPSATNLVSKELNHKANEPLVSVLMTTYNSAEFVKSAVLSLLTQTYKNIEIIIVDDASTDTTFDVLADLSRQHKSIKYFRLPQNCGTYVAKTVAFHYATGEFVTCQDSDDWSHPERIERQVMPLLTNKNLIATISNWVRIQDNGELFARGAFPLVRLNPASPLFRKNKVLEKMGLWDLVKTGADSEFIARLKLVFGRKTVLRVSEPLCFGAHREGSLMTAADTGYAENGLNNDRTEYWEAWGKWHIESLACDKQLKVNPLTNFSRDFAAPTKLDVALEKINHIAQFIKN